MITQCVPLNGAFADYISTHKPSMTMPLKRLTEENHDDDDGHDNVDSVQRFT